MRNGQQAVIAHNERDVVAKVMNNAFLLIDIIGDALIFMIADPPLKPQRMLCHRQQSAIERTYRHSSDRMGMDDASDIVARGMNRAVDIDACRIGLGNFVVNNPPINADLAQITGANLVKEQGIGIDQKNTLLARYTGRYMRGCEIGQPVQIDQTAAGRKIDATRQIGRAHV